MRIAFMLLGWCLVLMMCNDLYGQSSCSAGVGIAISGTVVDFSGTPWKGAEIQVKTKTPSEGTEKSSTMTKQTTSDERGEYCFSNLIPASYEVSVEPAGTGILRQASSTPVIEKGESFEVDFGLEIGSLGECPMHAVFGFVKRADGKPSEGAKVSLVNAFNVGRTLSSKTDKRGHYRIELCNPGQYILFLNTPGTRVQARELNFKPGVLSREINFALNWEK